MQIIIFIILVLVGLFLLAYLIAAIVGAIPMFGTGALVIFLFQKFAIRNKIKKTRNTNELISIATIDLKKDELNMLIDEKRFNSMTSHFRITVVSTSILLGIGAAALWIPLVRYYWEDNAFFASISYMIGIAAFIFLAIQISGSFSERIKSSLIKELQNITGSVKEELVKLHEIQENQKRITVDKGVDCTWDYVASVEDFMTTNKNIRANNISLLTSHIRDKINEAKYDQKQLTDALNEHDKAMEKYYFAANSVNKSGSVTLITLLDDLFNGLETIKILITDRNWEEYFDGIQFAMAELENLQNNTEKYSQYYNRKKEFTEAHRPDDPYDVLGVSPEMSAAQIKQVYEKLAKIYHPDANLVKDPDQKRMKEINNAYEEIMKERH